MLKQIIDLVYFLWPLIILLFLIYFFIRNLRHVFKKKKASNVQSDLDNPGKENLGNDAIKTENTNSKEINLDINFGLGTIPIKVKNKTIYALLLFVASSIMISIFLFRDYSYAYNDTYEFEVFYNEEKIEEIISMIKERDTAIKIPSDWELKKINYLDTIPLQDSPFIEEVLVDETIGDYLHTTGLSVHKTKYYRFFQNYKIEKVEGFLKHEYNPPNKKGVVFTTTYQLIPADNNLIEPTFSDFLKGNYISRLRIGQTVTCNSNVDYSIPIISFTKSQFFPINKIEFSLFCLEVNKEIIPFAYARYVD